MRKKKICDTCGEERHIHQFGCVGGNNHRYEYDNCDTCRHRLKNDPERLVIQKKKKIKCIFDPTESYSGSWFTRTVFRETLKAGYWPPGSKWQYGYDKDLFMVKGKECYPQRLVKCGP